MPNSQSEVRGIVTLQDPSMNRCPPKVGTTSGSKQTIHEQIKEIHAE